VLLLVLAVLGVASGAQGQSAAAAPPPSAGQEPDYSSRVFEPLDPSRQMRYWAEGRNRWFVSGMFDTGLLYVRPRFSAGWGRPHYAWAGFDANPLANGEGAGGYFGVRGTLPFIDLRIGARYFHTFERSFLCPTTGYERPGRCRDEPVLPSFQREDLESRVGPKSIYLTYESELTLNVPVGEGRLLSETAISYVTGVDSGYFVYEELIRVILDPPWVLRSNVGYAFALDEAGAISVAPLVEVVHGFGRNETFLRAGFTGRVRLYANLEARGFFIPSIAGPDTLGQAGGNFFQLGVRYRWSTD
jgi:hypothetical protein